MRTPPPLLLCAASALVLATGCDNLFFVDAQTDEVCKTEQVEQVGGVPLAVDSTLERSLPFPVGAFGETALPKGSVQFILRARSFSVTATDPTIDLSGIKTATVSGRRVGDTGPGTVLLSFTRTAGAPASNRFELTGDQEVDLLDFNRGEDLELVFKASGALPSRDWTPELRGCAGLHARGDYSDLVF
ncbi:hypothetical protein FGE12_04900 [Aggregicoccus sp. 17bor-14]|uniref:hypothetical protein n=1 Tax=Myxococcaceae TaxID=31 RepID=UPI00129CD026|nr:MULTISPECIES: hypothetical protein [Myxococcaceae]MBF5041718.1 hypothetical protein [Simulacricoccus sp. 17bor-14]MRI87499.1 hypothetical protein [Aggregicoccus sp. 17bor-14]